MYEKDGEKYFVVDGHTHFWDASPENWVPGQEEYAKGWIECFHAYHGLGPPETHWPLDRFEKYSEELMMHDLFEVGHVDKAIFQPTNLRQWYKNGFNTTESDGAMAERHPDKFLVNTTFDPREGEAGMRAFEERVKRYGCKGVKLYTAEWRGASRGWSLKSPEAARYLERGRPQAGAHPPGCRLRISSRSGVHGVAGECQTGSADSRD